MATNTETRWSVWGRGAPSSPLLREADGAATWAPEALEWLQGLAEEDRVDAWCVDVEGAEDDVDAATRYDAAVAGFARAIGQ